MVTYWLDKIYKTIAVGMCARSTGNCVGWKLICKGHGAQFETCLGLDNENVQEAHAYSIARATACSHTIYHVLS